MDNLKETAKKVTITELYSGELKRSGRALVGLCLIHEDDNPSFAIYEDTNSWYCFAGCGGGDVISFYQRIKGVDFKTAIKELARLAK